MFVFELKGAFFVCVFFLFGIYYTRGLIWHLSQSSIMPSLNLYKFGCEITLESNPGTNQYLPMSYSCVQYL